MIESISFPNFATAIAMALALGILYAAIMYFRESKFSNPPLARSILSFLRAFSISLIIILLFSPVIKSIKEEVKPSTVILANDVSQSMAGFLKNKNDFREKWLALEDDLSSSFQVKKLEFASRVSEDTLAPFQKNSTNYSELFTYIEDNYADQNVGAIVLHSDGIFNEGNNPFYMDAIINTPLYIIAQGDTTRYKDLMISDVFFNKIAYLGDKITIQVDLKAYNATNTSTRLIVESGSKNNSRKRFEENIRINNKEFFDTRTIELEAGEVGITRYRIAFLPLGDEKNKVNNFKDIYIEVLDGRQKILVYAHAPHPDVSALRQQVDLNKNYQVEVAYASETVPNMANFDIVILHNLPSEKFPIKNELSQLAAKKTPLMYIVGMQTSLPLFNQTQELISISGNSKNTEEIQVESSPSFTSYTISDGLKNAIKTYPPLLTPFGEYKIKGNASVFSYQTIKKIKTNYPQLVLGESKGVRTSVFCGEGLWKWRLVDYVQNKSYDNVAELLGKSLQWTSIKEDKRKFRVNPGKTVYYENEPILVEAQLYNDNYELINEPDASLIIKSEEGKEYSYTFSKTNRSYSINAGMFPAGSYSLQASVTMDNRLQTAKNSFTIEAIDLEQQDLVARHDVLSALIKKHGGKMIYPDSLEFLSKIIQSDNTLKPTVFQSKTTKSIIHLKWICLLILFLLGLEWFFRRYLGSY